MESKRRRSNLKLLLLLVSLVIPPLAFAESPLVTIERALTPVPISATTPIPVSGNSSAPLQPDLVTTGTIDMTSTSSTAVVNTSGYAGATVRFTRSTETGTMEFDISADGTNWTQVIPLCSNANGGYYTDCSLTAGSGLASVTNNYQYEFAIAGSKQFRLKVQGAGAGAALPYTIVLSAQSNRVVVGGVFPGTINTALGKTANTAAADVKATGSVGVLMLGVGNSSYGTMGDASGNYSAIGLTSRGAVLANVDTQNQTSNQTGLLKNEDAAAIDTQAGVTPLTVREDTLSSATSASGDNAWVKSNSLGAVYVQVHSDGANGGAASGLTSAATNNSTNVKASATTLFAILACNTTAAVKYVKLYNKASAPTCGTDTPYLRISVPANQCVSGPFPGPGAQFPAGLGYCIVTGVGDADNTAVAANDVYLNVSYK